MEDGYSVNAWFQHDWKPLTADDVERGLKLLTWSRADLLDAVNGLSDVALDTHLPGQRWNIRGVLGHVGGAEWWYLDRLGQAFPRALVPQDVFERLRVVRLHLNDVLPELVGSRQVVGINAEFWSPRKVLRRAAWHERDTSGNCERPAAFSLESCLPAPRHPPGADRACGRQAPGYTPIRDRPARSGELRIRHRRKGAVIPPLTQLGGFRPNVV